MYTHALVVLSSLDVMLCLRVIRMAESSILDLCSFGARLGKASGAVAAACECTRGAVDAGDIRCPGYLVFVASDIFRSSTVRDFFLKHDPKCRP